MERQAMIDGLHALVRNPTTMTNAADLIAAWRDAYGAGSYGLVRSDTTTISSVEAAMMLVEAMLPLPPAPWHSVIAAHDRLPNDLTYSAQLLTCMHWSVAVGVEGVDALAQWALGRGIVRFVSRSFISVDPSNDDTRAMMRQILIDTPRKAAADRAHPHDHGAIGLQRILMLAVRQSTTTTSNTVVAHVLLGLAQNLPREAWATVPVLDADPPTEPLATWAERLATRQTVNPAKALAWLAALRTHDGRVATTLPDVPTISLETAYAYVKVASQGTPITDDALNASIWLTTALSTKTAWRQFPADRPPAEHSIWAWCRPTITKGEAQRILPVLRQALNRNAKPALSRQETITRLRAVVESGHGVYHEATIVTLLYALTAHLDGDGCRSLFAAYQAATDIEPPGDPLSRNEVLAWAKNVSTWVFISPLQAEQWLLLLGADATILPHPRLLKVILDLLVMEQHQDPLAVRPAELRVTLVGSMAALVDPDDDRTWVEHYLRTFADTPIAESLRLWEGVVRAHTQQNPAPLRALVRLMRAVAETADEWDDDKPEIDYSEIDFFDNDE